MKMILGECMENETGIVQKQRQGKRLSKMKQSVRENIGVICIGLIALCIHLAYLGEVPYGLHLDELGTGYDAWAIANYGVDRYLKSFPVYLINFGGGQNSLYCYLCVIFIKFFGFSTTTIRLPAFFSACLLVIFGYQFVWKKWKSRQICLAFLSLYTILPIFTISARFGLESYLMLPFSTVFLLLCVSAIETPSVKGYLLCGISGGILLYTYALSYIVLPIFLLFLIIYLIYLKKISGKNTIIFLISLGFLAMPLILVQIVNRFGLGEFKMGIFTITKLLSYRSDEISLFNFWHNLPILIKCILGYDWLPYNGFKTYGNVYWISIPFILIGLWKTTKESFQSMTEKKFDPSVLILFWALAEFIMGGMLGGNGPNTNKINGIFFCVLYFLLQGMIWAYQVIGKWRIQGIALITVIYLIFSFSFLKYYFLEYKEDVYPQHLFAGTYEEAIDYLNGLGEGISNRTTYIGNMKQAYIYFLGSTLTSPYEYDIQKTGTKSYKNYIFSLPTEIDLSCNYIVRKSESSFIEKMDMFEFKKIEFGEYYLYYMEE